MKGITVEIVALVLFAVFALLGFGWRSWKQKRQTGSTGFRGVSGRVGSVEWFAGAGFVVAFAAAVIAAAGIFGTVYAQLDMGDSWRIGVDPTETTTLVRSGVFGWVRNPIFTAMMVFAFGIALITPNIVAIAGFLLIIVTIELQVRVVEEPHLLTVHGDVYRRYRAEVGRFVPGVGLSI